MRPAPDTAAVRRAARKDRLVLRLADPSVLVCGFVNVDAPVVVTGSFLHLAAADRHLARP
jgi:hypothetical protein